MSEPKFKIGDVVLVNDTTFNLINVPAKVIKIGQTDGLPDYLCKPLTEHHNFCRCQGLDCGGSAWFLEPDVN